MQEFLCPQCGAPARFESTGAVMVVCGSCRSTLTRDAEGARRIGQLSEVQEDYSPVRLGTRGGEGTWVFQVVGRLRLEYEAGAWNEWYVQFDDGRDGWLSDASGQYALTRRTKADLPMPLPAFDALEVGQALKIDGVLHTICDRRVSRCVGGEGELPVAASDGWEVRAADGRGGSRFTTIDYSDGEPVIYSGHAIALDDLDEQTLRSAQEIEASTGRYRGKVLPLDCPNCAGTVTIAAAMATQVVCPSCGSLLDCAGERAQIIEGARRAASFKSTLPLGARGRLNQVDYTVLGIMRCDVPEDPSEPAWTEYLLFNPGRGYLWLVETTEGWQRVTVCDEWPQRIDDNTLKLKGAQWGRRYQYVSRVTEVVGAFNWRVRRGDTTLIVDYANGAQQTLSCERTPDEIGWSHATAIPAAVVATAFGLSVPASRRARPELNSSDPTDKEFLPGIAMVFSFVLLLFSDDITWGAMMLGLALLWAPVALVSMNADSQKGGGSR